MDFLHKELQLEPNDLVEVTLDHAANVQLLDPHQFDLYRQGKPYRYFGGYARRSPFRIAAPEAGRWFVVVDLGGGAGKVNASIRVLSNTLS